MANSYCTTGLSIHGLSRTPRGNFDLPRAESCRQPTDCSITAKLPPPSLMWFLQRFSQCSWDTDRIPKAAGMFAQGESNCPCGRKQRTHSLSCDVRKALMLSECEMRIMVSSSAWQPLLFSHSNPRCGERRRAEILLLYCCIVYQHSNYVPE